LYDAFLNIYFDEFRLWLLSTSLY